MQRFFTILILAALLSACAPQRGLSTAVIPPGQPNPPGDQGATPNVAALATPTGASGGSAPPEAQVPTNADSTTEPQSSPGAPASEPAIPPTPGAPTGGVRRGPLGTPVPVYLLPEPTVLPASGLPDGETLQQMLVHSHENWTSLFAEAETVWYSGDAARTIRSQEKVQVWILRPFFLLAISGPIDGAPVSLWIADGKSYLMPGMTAQPFPEYITNPPPVVATDATGIPPSPPESFLPNPLVDLLYPIGLAGRPGAYAPQGTALIADRNATMLEYKPAYATNRLDRFWMDAQTGVLLGWQNFTKPDGRYISAETMITRIEYNLPLPESLFTLEASLPAAFAQSAGDTAGFLP